MEMTVKYPVDEQYAKQWDGKTFCDVILKDEATNLEYTLFAAKDGPAWTVKAGDKIEVEIKEAPANGKRGKVRLPGGNKSGGTWKPRPFTIPDNESAGKAAEYACNLYKAVKGRLPEISDEAAARISSAIFNRTT